MDEQAIDITDSIERIDEKERRFGVRLEALYAEWEAEDGLVTLNGELHTTSKDKRLKDDLDLVIAVYDDRGRVIATSVINFETNQFHAFSVFSDLFSVPKVRRINKVRVYPDYY